MCLDWVGKEGWEPSAIYWGAFDDETLVGFAGVKPSEADTRAVYLCNAAVLPEARGHRLQRRLIRVRLRWAKEQGFTLARTYTLTDNPASARSLIACGFKPFWPDVPWAGPHVCYWLHTQARAAATAGRVMRTA